MDEQVAESVAWLDSLAITQRYQAERTRRGMMKQRLWPPLPPEPREPWERLTLLQVRRLLHEPLIRRPCRHPKVRREVRMDWPRYCPWQEPTPEELLEPVPIRTHDICLHCGEDVTGQPREPALMMQGRFGLSVVPSPWRFHVGSVP